MRSTPQDIRGRVLEVRDDRYTSTIGGDRVDRADILDILPSNPKATIVADLEDGDGIPDDAFDCIVLTQTLQMVYNLGAAATTLRRILAPGGVLLVTVPGITSLADREWRASWYWNFTTHSLRRILEEALPVARRRGPRIRQRDGGHRVPAGTRRRGVAS